MFKEFLTTACLFILLMGAWNAATEAGEKSRRLPTDLYIFGDSLSDSGNLFFLSGEIQPPSPPYFEGRFSNGPVWVESLSLLLDLEVDLDTNVVDDPLANNQAIGSAFTGFGSASGEPFGVLSQVENFVTVGGSFDPDDLVIVWAGANDYLFTDRTPTRVVGDLSAAIKWLAIVGGQRFLVPNLPNLGDTPAGVSSGNAADLNALTAAHNAVLLHAIAELRTSHRLDIVLLDVNTTFIQVLENPQVFGFNNVSTPCLVRQPDGTTSPTGACPPAGTTFNAAGVLFWDLVHPTAAAHRQIAIGAYTTLMAVRDERLVANNSDHDDWRTVAYAR